MKIKDIFSISSGLNAKKNPQGKIYGLQVRDFKDDFSLEQLIQPSLVYSPKMERHFLHEGDLLMVSKSYTGFRCFVYEENNMKAVATSVFLVLKNALFNVEPRYVAWYINLKTTQHELLSMSRGSAISSINMKILGEVDIPMVPIKTQREIVAVSRLKKAESDLINEIDLYKTIELEMTLKNIID
ncbi:hypothetical protein JCM19296_56 [Nonlabens ulvanivorans]|uniref:Type I restriction modification DNA specificity domain-containing protein n=1 Tax=Nonlabens ulvanivorans TaxID=906888 RepID=A0A081D6D2_NONUL|nr:restriction endonuclease subunit S [Nonlabens ulvanivorans]GAK74478.1 hypothetical protein JCM19296_56 [Nonlabens ulvanivorans]